MTRRLLAVSALVVAVAACAAAVLAITSSGSSDDTVLLRRYAAAWSAGDDRAAAALTDQPAAARDQLAASRRGLDGARVRARIGSVRQSEGRITATLAVTWQIPRIGPWSYRTRIEARPAGDLWRVRWRPQTLHRALDRDSRLGTTRVAPPRGRIEDRRGRALVAERPVMHVAVETRRVRDAGETATRLAELLDVDRLRLERAIRAAPRGRFVPAITLRQADFERVSDALERVPGVSLAAGRAPLAPTKDFARALLGTVAPPTAEQLERAGNRLEANTDIGQWGLQAAFDRPLAGAPARAVVLRDRGTGVVLRTLRRWGGRASRKLRTTLDLDVQRAAERALATTGRRAALVALRPSTGDILAVANRPLASSLNRAFTGLYPPGSTFKIITTAALLRDGLSVEETVPCPPVATVDGRGFRNFEGRAQGPVPFAVDFAQSCNTAFVALAPRLQRTALTRTAADFGLGRRLRLPLAVADGKVPAAGDPVSRAAMMIGQDRILASPLTMAGVAAAVADGRWRAPRLVRRDPRDRGPALGAGEVATLRRLMRSVVTSGTGSALAGLPGEVAGKSGTAEYGGGDPPPTHAWFIAYRGDLALSVLVEGGRSGGSVAAPLAARFLAALP